MQLGLLPACSWLPSSRWADSSDLSPMVTAGTCFRDAASHRARQGGCVCVTAFGSLGIHPLLGSPQGSSGIHSRKPRHPLFVA